MFPISPARLADGGSFYLNHLAWADDLLFRCRLSTIDGDNALSSDFSVNQPSTCANTEAEVDSKSVQWILRRLGLHDELAPLYLALSSARTAPSPAMLPCVRVSTGGQGSSPTGIACARAAVGVGADRTGQEDEGVTASVVPATNLPSEPG